MVPNKSLIENASIFFLLLIFISPVYGRQIPVPIHDGTITGKVVDQTTGQPVGYANVILFTRDGDKEITGAGTDGSGRFTLSGVSDGKYYLRIQLIGYKIKTVRGVTVTDSNPRIDLGRIHLIATAISLPNVVTEARRSAITFQPGKQIVAASQIKTAAGGTAADVLEAVPSISVDINGNVSLRGSTNFQVLIDGRPSVMSAQNALQQIPAAAIKNIEIMTNPSAKYDASGTAGIINIILRKNSALGWSGILNLDGGLDDKYGGNFILQYRTPFVSYDAGLDFNRRTFPGSNRQIRQFIIGNSVSDLNSNGSELWQRILSGVRGGVDFNLSKRDNLSFGGRYGGRAFHHYSALNTFQSSNLQQQQLYYLDNHNYDNYGTFYELNSNYVHKFGRGDNKITGYLSYRNHSSNQTALSTATQGDTTLSGTRTTELGPHNELRGNVDYTLPIGKSERFSAGSEFFTRTYRDINKLYSYDSTTADYNFQPPFSHNNYFNRSRFAAYSIFSDKWDSLQAQAGFRTEYTYQLVAQTDSSRSYKLSRWDYFPSLSASYSFADGTQAMASYTRRIERPDGGDLEPYYSWFDANTVHIGNPSLKPELIDSYEMGIQTYLGQASISSDLYYRFTQDKIEHINSVYAQNVTLTSVANVGNDYALGYEFSLQVNPVRLWQLNVTGDLYDYRITGAINSQSFARESLDWSAKSNNTFTISHSTEVELNARYHSPSVTAQGKWGGYFVTDLAVRQDIIPRKLSLTLQVNDLLNTGRREFVTQGTDFYNHDYYYRDAPVVMLNLQYNFNDYKSPRGQNNNQND